MLKQCCFPGPDNGKPKTPKKSKLTIAAEGNISTKIIPVAGSEFPSNHAPELVVPLEGPLTGAPFPCNFDRKTPKLPQPSLKRGRSPSPDEWKPNVPRPERKKPKLSTSRISRPFVGKQRLLRLLHRQKVIPKKVVAVPLRNALSGELASKIASASPTETPESATFSHQETLAVFEGHEIGSIASTSDALVYSRLPTATGKLSGIISQETSAEVQVNPGSKLDTPLALLGTKPPADNPRKVRSQDKMVVARSRLISKLRNRRWSPYPTNDTRKRTKTSNLDHLDVGEIGKGLVRELAPTTIRVQPNDPSDVDIASSNKALVEIRKPSSALSMVELKLMDYAGLPSNQPMACRSEEIESTEPATLVVLPESIGQAIEEQMIGNVSEVFGGCETDTTSIHQTCRLPQEGTAPGTGAIGLSQDPLEKCTINASSDGPNLQRDRLYTSTRTTRHDQVHMNTYVDGDADFQVLPPSPPRKVDTQCSQPGGEHDLDLPSTLAQPPRPNIQLRGNIDFENAANMECDEQNEQGRVRQAETSLLSEKAAGKKRAESQPDGSSGGERPREDAGGEQGSCDEGDDGKSAEKPAPRYKSPFNPEEMYDYLVRYPNLPCTNGPVALLCELVVDLKSTMHSLRRSTEPAIEESATPTNSRRRSNRKGQKSKTENQSRDKKRQPSFLVNLKADIRRLMHEFLEYPEKELTVPAPTQLKQYKNNSEGPGLDPLVLDLASKGSSDWNKKAVKLFREEFLSLDISECNDEGQIEAIFLTHVDYLRKVYLKQGLDVVEKVDAAQRAKDKAKYARRKELRERRFKTALLPYQNISEMKNIRTIVSSFPMEVVSDDEREVIDGKEHYLVVGLDWRSSQGDSLCEILDSLHMASHFTTDDRPRPGRFSHPRTPSHRLYTELAPSGLPSNLYKLEYLEGLTPDELDALNVQPAVALRFPARVMRIAARFRHIKCRGTAPLPRNDPGLSIYVDGATYEAFIV